MPDAGSKKRPTQQTGSGKLSKKGISVEDIPVIETVTVIDASCAENEEDVIKPFEPLSPIPEPVKDIMRTEPLLYPVIIDKYDGETDEYGFYHGEGIAHLKDGMVYSGMFERGKMHGHGLFTWADGTTYSGDFIHNVISGKGYM